MWAAALNTNPDVLITLLKVGPEINSKSSNGRPPPIIAASHNSNPEVVIELLNSCADGSIKENYGNTAFNLAKENPAIKGTTAYRELNEAQYK